MLLFTQNLGGGVAPPITGTLLTVAQIAAAKAAIAVTLVTSAQIVRGGVVVATLACRVNNGKHFSLSLNSTLRGRFNWVIRFAAGANVLKGDIIRIGTAQYEVRDVDSAFPDGLSLIALAEQTAY
jgi:hypothetical protein